MDKLTSYIELDIPLPESLPSPMIEEIIQLVLSDIWCVDRTLDAVLMYVSLYTVYRK